jgi:LacI family transcriptional regulator
MKRATIRDVAARAGVSIATASNVFNGRKTVRPESVLKVEEAARALAYKLDRAASQLRSGRVRVVGMLVPNLNDAFFSALVSHVVTLAEEAGYQVLVASAHDDPGREATRLDALLGWKPSGLIAVPCTNAIPDMLRREFGSLPIILADRVGETGLPVDTVTVDNYDAGRAAAEHLLACGHRRIAIAASVSEFRPIAQRIRGVADACAAHGAEAPAVVDVGVDPDAGAEYLCRWLDDTPNPTAIIGMTNVTTLAVLSALAQRRLDVPEAISLVGFDDYAWMTARKVPLTAMRQPIAGIAAAIWDRLAARMAGETGPPRDIVLKVDLQRRSSVTCPASATEASPAPETRPARRSP